MVYYNLCLNKHFILIIFIFSKDGKIHRGSSVYSRDNKNVVIYKTKHTKFTQLSIVIRCIFGAIVKSCKTTRFWLSKTHCNINALLRRGI